MDEAFVAEKDEKTECFLGYCFLTYVVETMVFEAVCPSFDWWTLTLKNFDFDLHLPMVSVDLVAVVVQIAEPKVIVVADETSVEVEEEFDYRAFVTVD